MTAYPRDEAWNADTQKDNLLLKDGDAVVLLHATLDDWKRVVPAGSEGVVIHARTPRVYAREGREAHYFANVDLDDGTRVRVPHSALRIL